MRAGDGNRNRMTSLEGRLPCPGASCDNGGLGRRQASARERPRLTARCCLLWHMRGISPADRKATVTVQVAVDLTTCNLDWAEQRQAEGAVRERRSIRDGDDLPR